MRKKKLLLRSLSLLIIAVAAAALINPYSRQLMFGPKYAGVPLCAWQERLRREAARETKDGYVAKVLRWFQLKDAALPVDKLTREEKIAIWLSLLDDPIPAVRVRSVQTLWGGHGHWRSRVWLDLSSIRLNSTSVRSTSVAFLGDGTSSTVVLSDEWLGFDGPWESIQPPCDVAPHLVRMIDDPDADVRNAVFVALSSLRKKAEPAFPRLFELLNHADATRRTQAATALNDTHPKTRDWLDRLVAMLDDADATVRGHAAGCLQAWSRSRMAAAAGPALRTTLRDPDASVRLRAATALAALGVQRREASEAIRAGLRHPDAGIRSQALGYLFDSGNQDALLADLTRCVHSDPDQAVRRGAVAALHLVGKQAVPLVVSLLQHPEKEMRLAAVRTLANLRDEARAAVPYLIASLEDDLASECIGALGCIGGADAIPKLIALLDDSAFCTNALSALNALGSDAWPATPRLVKLLEDGTPEIRHQAANTLAAIGRHHDDLPALLLPHVREARSLAHQDAVKLLAQLDPDHEEALPALKRLAFEVAQPSRSDVFRALRDLGPKARPLVPLLLRRLDKANEEIRAACVQLLGAVGPQAAPAVPALMRLAEPPHAALGALAIAALGDIASDDDKVVPLLVRLMRKDDTVEAALAALGGFGRRGGAALPHVLPHLKSDRTTTRTAAALALCKIIARPEDELVHLTPLLRDEDDGVRAQLAKMLADLGPAAVPALCVLLNDDSQRIYEAALDALAKIEP